MVDRIITLNDVLDTAQNIHETSMLSTNTASANTSAFVTDCTTAAAAGKSLRLASGKIYDIGNASQTVIDLAGTLGVYIDMNGSTFRFAPYTSADTFFRFTTASGWVDYDSTAFVQGVSSGASMATTNEVSTITLVSPPGNFARSEMVSVYSNDPLYYGRAGNVFDGDYELNWQHEISQILTHNTGVTYLASKLLYNYTPSNAGTRRVCKLRRYNNENIIFKIDNGFFTVTGDPDSVAVASSTRAKAFMEFYGFKNPVVGANINVLKGWQGAFVFCSCFGHVDLHNSKLLPNTLSALDVNNSSVALGYDASEHGANAQGRFLNKQLERARHITTTWSEGYIPAIGTPTSSSTNTVFPFTWSTKGPSNAIVQVGDYVLLESVGGTLGTSVNGTYHIVTAVVVDTSFTIAFDSSALTKAAGGTAKIWDPTKVATYGESVGSLIDGLVYFGASGAYVDEHENCRNGVRKNIHASAGAAFSYESTHGRVINNRGANMLYKDVRMDGFNQLAMWNSYSQNHGGQNHNILDGYICSRQANRANTAPLHEVISGSFQTITDKQKLTLRDGIIQDGYYQFLRNYVNSPDIDILNHHFSGDWGVASPANSILRLEAGNILFEDTIFDFTNVVTAATIRMLTASVGAFNLTFRRCDFRNIFAPAGSSQYPFNIQAGANGSVISFEQVKIKYAAGQTANTNRFLIANGSTITVNMRDVYVENAAKIVSTAGLIAISNASSVVTGMKENVRGDAAFNIAGSSIGAGSSYTPTTPTAGT